MADDDSATDEDPTSEKPSNRSESNDGSSNENIDRVCTEAPIADVSVEKEQQPRVEVRQVDERVEVVFCISPETHERLEVAASERAITKEELLDLFIENVDLFVPFPPQTAAYIRQAAKGQPRRATYRLVEQALRERFNRKDWQ